VVNITLQPLHPLEKISRHRLVRRLGGPQRQYGPGGEERKVPHCPCRESNPSRPDGEPATANSLNAQHVTLPHFIPHNSYKDMYKIFYWVSTARTVVRNVILVHMGPVKTPLHVNRKSNIL